MEKGKEPEVRTVVLEPLHALVTLGGDEGAAFDDALRLVGEASLPADTFIRLNVRLGAGEPPGPDWTESARSACLEKDFRFCTINPIRPPEQERKETNKRTLTMAELKELSDDEVFTILNACHKLSERQRDLVKDLMKEVMA